MQTDLTAWGLMQHVVYLKLISSVICSWWLNIPKRHYWYHLCLHACAHAGLLTLHAVVFTLEPRVTFVANSKCEFLPHDQVFPVVEKFSTSIWRKPFSVKATLNISVESAMVHSFLYFFELNCVLVNPFWVQCWDFCPNQNRCSYGNKILNLDMLNFNVT